MRFRVSYHSLIAAANQKPISLRFKLLEVVPARNFGRSRSFQEDLCKVDWPDKPILMMARAIKDPMGGAHKRVLIHRLEELSELW